MNREKGAAGSAVSQTEATGELRHAWEQRLYRDHGPFVSGRPLARLLGYSAQSAFLQAARRGALPIRSFHMKGQRGHFAHVRDLAAWLATSEVPADIGLDRDVHCRR